jgi:AP-1 complex subunit gamma-1
LLSYLNIHRELSKPNPSNTASTRIICKFTNSTNSSMDSLVFQAAVPKYLKLELLPSSSTSIPAESNGQVTQEIRLINSMQGEKNIMLKLKISYSVNGTTIEEQITAATFPAGF